MKPAIIAGAVVACVVAAGLVGYVVTRPSPPTGGAVTVNTPTGTTSNSTALTWSQSTDADFANYAVYKSTSSGTLGDLVTTITNKATTSYTVTGLASSTTYYFTIRANRAGGAYSDSNQVSATTSGTPGGQPGENQPKIRLYYTYPITPEKTETRLNFGSAASNDGINFTAESGARLSYETAGQQIGDPDFFQESSSKWTVFYSKAVTGDPKLYKATNSAANGTFTPDTTFTGNLGNISSTIKIGNTFYVYTAASEGIAVCTYNPSTNQLTLVKTAISGQVFDPTVVQLSTNSFKMYYKQQGNVYSANSTDGQTWTGNTLLISNAEVPGAVYVDGKIYLYYVNRDPTIQGNVMVKISSDGGATFSAAQAVNGAFQEGFCDPNPVAGTTAENQAGGGPGSVGLNFTADSGTRVTGGSVPCIVQLPLGTYRLYYTSGQDICSASSTDGLNFTADSGKRITKGGASDPDRDSASSPVLIQFGTNSFKLFYEGVSGSSRVLLSATSTDGLNFTKQSGVRYSGGPSDGGIVSAFDIVKESDTLLRMYYVADWNGKNNVRTATSTDGGNSWTFERGNICGDDSAGGGPNTYVDPDIVKLPSGGYKLYTKKGADKIYSFSSTDGLNFTQDSGVRLQASQFAGLGVTQLLDPDTIVFADGSMRMFLGAMQMGIVSASSTT